MFVDAVQLNSEIKFKEAVERKFGGFFRFAIAGFITAV
jgi:hypothetical protein